MRPLLRPDLSVSSQIDVLTVRQSAVPLHGSARVQSSVRTAETGHVTYLYSVLIPVHYYASTAQPVGTRTESSVSLHATDSAAVCDARGAGSVTAYGVQLTLALPSLLLLCSPGSSRGAAIQQEFLRG